MLYENDIVVGVLDGNCPLPLNVIIQIQVAEFHIDKVILECP